MSTTAIIKVNFSGLNGAGTISIPGLLTGDVRLMWFHDQAPNGGEELNIFDQVVTADGQIQQIATFNASTETYTAFFLRMT